MNTRLIVIIAVIFLILAGGAVGGYWYLSNQKQDGADTSLESKKTLLFGGGSSGPNAKSEAVAPSEKGTSSIAAGGIISLTKLAPNKIAGAVALSSGSTTLVRFAEAGTGHVYEINLTSGEIKRLTNTTIPKVEEAVWTEGGRGVLLRYISDENVTKTFYGRVSTSSKATSTEEGPLSGSFLPDNIVSLTTLSDSNKIFYLVEDDDGVSGFLSNPDGTKSSLVYSSPIKKWQTSPIDKDSVGLYPNASGEASGIFIFLTPSLQSAEYYFSNETGITALASGNKNFIAYSRVNNGILEFGIFDRKANIRSSIFPITLPEKCAWSRATSTTLYCAATKNVSNNNLLDLWYQGRISFTDDIWKFDASTGESSEVSSLTEKANIDAVSLFFDKRESYLFFTNRKDRTLWTLPLR